MEMQVMPDAGWHGQVEWECTVLEGDLELVKLLIVCLSYPLYVYGTRMP